jgi:hypothetical protein
MRCSSTRHFFSSAWQQRLLHFGALTFNAGNFIFIGTSAIFSVSVATAAAVS